MNFGVFMPPFSDFAEPDAVAALAADAERAGWDGFFLWDHVLAEPGMAVADVWVTLSVVAAATSRVRLGALVTPLARRRPWVLARQAITLDRLSHGRVNVGIGLGTDEWRELSAFGEETDPRARGRLLDESLDVLRLLVRGEPVSHHGELTVDTDAFRPGPVQAPLPIWAACSWPHRRPLTRAARLDGCFVIFPGPRPIPLPDPHAVGTVASVLHDRGARPDADLIIRADLTATASGVLARQLAALQDTGVTWVLHNFEPSQLEPASVRRVVRAGPPTL
jgi:alkanesulfonate monooxygenase SsuD/methylene tetrahydromethanopterin reductase-like flavin-dependent oxidoreductase (luciferase family)